MKKSILLITMTLISSYVANAQIKVFSGGKVNVGATSTPTELLEVTSGHINIATNTKGLMLGGTKVLYHYGNTSDIFVGHNAGNTSMSGHYNTYMGLEAGTASTSGTSNSFFGSQSGKANTSGTGNSFLGYQSGYSNTTGSYNSFFGSQAGGLNTTASYNSFFGYQAGINTTTGPYNVSLGYQAGYTNTTATSNTFVGYQSGYSNDASYNVFLGYRAGYANTSGSGNIFIGTSAGGANTSATRNGFIGYQAGYSNTTGNYNTSYGYQAGYSNTTGTYNTFLGYGTNANAGTYTNSTAVGNGALIVASNKMYLGDASLVGTYNASGTFAASDGRFKTNINENVKGLVFINKLRPVTYNMDTRALDNFMIQNLPDSLKQKHQEGMDFNFATSIIHSGFIAQEVEQASQQVGFNSSIVSVPTNPNEPYALSYAELVVPLVKAVQELSATTDSLKAVTAKQDSINNALQNQIQQLTVIINGCCPSGGLRLHNTNDNENINAPTNLKSTSFKQIELSNMVVLEQNSPNPFAEKTIISYYIPEAVKYAQIIFTEANGKIIKTVDINEKGKGELTVFAGNLSTGTYTYTLMIDGKTTDSKRMVCTK